jgi:hypothetical protein
MAVEAHIALCARCRLATISGGLGDAAQVSVQEGYEGWPGKLPPLRLEPWVPQTKDVETAIAPFANGLGECVYLLRAAPKANLALAGLDTAFLLLVLVGGIELGGRRLGAGDLIELDSACSAAFADPALGATVLVLADEPPRRGRRR